MLEMREMEAFLAVAEELHVGRAAERLGLPTSRVSRLLRVVERRADARLVERDSRIVGPPPQGTRLYGELRAAYDRIEQAVDEIRGIRPLHRRVRRVRRRPVTLRHGQQP